MVLPRYQNLITLLIYKANSASIVYDNLLILQQMLKAAGQYKLQIKETDRIHSQIGKCALERNP